MSHTRTWRQFSDALNAHPTETLAAYLGDRAQAEFLTSKGVVWPRESNFRTDPAFDPNPHKLDLPRDSLDAALMMHSFALWGPSTIVYSSLVCARLQCSKQSHWSSELDTLRSETLAAVEYFLESPGPLANQGVANAASRCQAAYAPFEDEPDSKDGQSVWYDLGAVWFTAEVMANDFRLQGYDGSGPREASATWCRRNTVWSIRAADAAAHWSSWAKTRQAIQQELSAWVVEVGID